MTLVHFEVLKVDYFQQHVLMCLRLPDMYWFKWRVNIRGSLSVSNQFNPCFIWVCARADRLGNCICESETARCYILQSRFVMLLGKSTSDTDVFLKVKTHQCFPLDCSIASARRVDPEDPNWTLASTMFLNAAEFRRVDHVEFDARPVRVFLVSLKWRFEWLKHAEIRQCVKTLYPWWTSK